VVAEVRKGESVLTECQGQNDSRLVADDKDVPRLPGLEQCAVERPASASCQSALRFIVSAVRVK